jgi:hypothetical protein
MNVISHPSKSSSGLQACAAVLCLLLALGCGSFALADDVTELERAIVKLTEKPEKEGFDFRADIWARDLAPEVGKAVRVQFFKGNEYRVCVAVPPSSKVKLAAHVLDADGKPMENKIEATEGGWGVILHVKPKRTGVYAVVMRQAESSGKAVPCAMISGYK